MSRDEISFLKRFFVACFFAVWGGSLIYDGSFFYGVLLIISSGRVSRFLTEEEY